MTAVLKIAGSAISEQHRNDEATITNGLQTFYEVGCALARIRDSKSYKLVAGFDTFEEYCRERWDMGYRHANKVIAAADVVHNLTPIGVTPTVESQARPLTKLAPEQQREAWQRALELAGDRRITAKLVGSVVDEFTLGDAVDGVAGKKQIGQKAVWNEVDRRLEKLVQFITDNCLTPPEITNLARDGIIVSLKTIDILLDDLKTQGVRNEL